MAIECNQIPQTANYLKQKFASCAKLEAADMDLLVELIEAVNNCGIAGDTTLFSNTILGGNVFWIENLDFGSTPITYIWNNQIFTAPARPLMTLSDAHVTLDRIDVFAIDSSTNSLKIIEGVPAISPQEPTINFETQLRVGAVLIQAGETAPEGITKELVYDENLGEPTEWATSSPQEGSIVVLDSTTYPSNGNINIYLKGVKDGHTIQFETSSPVTLANISSLSFNFFPKVGVIEQLNLKVSLIDGNNTNIAAGWYIYNNTFGLNVYADDYHTINATTDQLNFNNGLTTFNIIELEFTSRNGDITNLITEGYIDEVYLTSGFEGYTPGVLRWTELIDTDSNYTGKAGFVPVVRNGEDGLTLTDINTIVSENNKEKVKYILGATRTPDAIAAAINNSPTFTIAKDEIYTFIYNSFNDGAGSLYALMCKIKNYGKGTFGIGGTVLTGQDILIVSGVNSLILDIEESPLTQIINLPASTSTTVEAVFNAQPDFVVQEQNEGYRLVNITIDGNNLQYLFTGIGDTYGATSGNTALSTEFSLLNNTTVPLGGDSSTGLEALDEGNGTGWRLVGKDPTFYGNIGGGAVDFGINTSASSTLGATGDVSFNFGYDNTAAGYGSIILGYSNNISANSTLSHALGYGNTITSGYTSTALGYGNTISASYTNAFGVSNTVSRIYGNALGIGLIHRSTGGLAVGVGNTDYTQTGLNSDDGRLFIVGNGTLVTGSPNTVSSRNDAFIVRHSGLVTAPSLTTALISSEPTGKVLITKEYLNSISPQNTADCGTVIPLDTSGGHLCNMASANSATTYTTTGTVLNAYAKVLINTTSEPTVTGATKIAGATWVTGTDMYMVVNYNGNRMEYYFLEI